MQCGMIGDPGGARDEAMNHRYQLRYLARGSGMFLANCEG